MSTPIDFTEWTDAQLDAGEQFAHIDPNGPALLAEIKRRKSEGVPSDGSHDRVAALIASARPLRRRSVQGNGAKGVQA